MSLLHNLDRTSNCFKYHDLNHASLGPLFPCFSAAHKLTLLEQSEFPRVDPNYVHLHITTGESEGGPVGPLAGGPTPSMTSPKLNHERRLGGGFSFS